MIGEIPAPSPAGLKYVEMSIFPSRTPPRRSMALLLIPVVVRGEFPPETDPRDWMSPEKSNAPTRKPSPSPVCLAIGGHLSAVGAPAHPDHAVELLVERQHEIDAQQGRERAVVAPSASHGLVGEPLEAEADLGVSGRGHQALWSHTSFRMRGTFTSTTR